MGLSNAQWDAMAALEAAHDSPDAAGWVTPTSGIPEAALLDLARFGLCVMADEPTRAAMGPGDHLRWAARLTPDGHDVLTYRPSRETHAVQWLAKQADSAYQEVALQPTEMTLIRRYLSAGPRLRRSPAEGLDDAVLEAFWDAPANRWRLQVTPAQMESIAHAFFLERFTGMTTASNRFGRDYDVMYRRAR